MCSASLTTQPSPERSCTSFCGTYSTAASNAIATPSTTSATAFTAPAAGTLSSPSTRSGTMAGVSMLTTFVAAIITPRRSTKQDAGITSSRRALSCHASFIGSTDTTVLLVCATRVMSYALRRPCSSTSITHSRSSTASLKCSSTAANGVVGCTTASTNGATRSNAKLSSNAGESLFIRSFTKPALKRNVYTSSGRLCAFMYSTTCELGVSSVTDSGPTTCSSCELNTRSAPAPPTTFSLKRTSTDCMLLTANV